MNKNSGQREESVQAEGTPVITLIITGILTVLSVLIYGAFPTWYFHVLLGLSVFCFVADFREKITSSLNLTNPAIYVLVLFAYKVIISPTPASMDDIGNRLAFGLIFASVLVLFEFIFRSIFSVYEEEDDDA